MNRLHFVLRVVACLMAAGLVSIAVLWVFSEFGIASLFWNAIGLNLAAVRAIALATLAAWFAWMIGSTILLSASSFVMNLNHRLNVFLGVFCTLILVSLLVSWSPMTDAEVEPTSEDLISTLVVHDVRNVVATTARAEGEFSRPESPNGRPICVEVASADADPVQIERKLRQVVRVEEIAGVSIRRRCSSCRDGSPQPCTEITIWIGPPKRLLFGLAEIPRMIDGCGGAVVAYHSGTSWKVVGERSYCY